MTTSDKFVQPAIPRFDGHYDFWSMTMKNFLRSKELWQLVEDGIPTLGATSTEVQRKSVANAQLKDLKVKNFLFQAIDREILETILDKSTSQAIWRSMQQKYQGSTRVKRDQLQDLRREFALLAIKDGEKVDSYLGRTLSVVNKMKSNGEVMDSSIVSSQPEEQVLKVMHDDKAGRGRGCGNRGRGRGRGKQPFNKALIECFQCHKLGHFQYECPGVEKHAHYTEAAIEDENEILLVAYEEVTHPVQMED
ncbi:uncharacterized protein LOC114169374 [Vigna unguiculata]|uniref:uncharacterized protein LOC114169374 n=1 Tax=Vigna unguiculata TaxID=3917 RepID=UPI001015FD78|nr:uncharacterized protein LOC114169374 [Vigna unguiculata]